MEARNWEGLRRNWPSASACLWMGALGGGLVLVELCGGGCLGLFQAC